MIITGRNLDYSEAFFGQDNVDAEPGFNNCVQEKVYSQIRQRGSI